MRAVPRLHVVRHGAVPQATSGRDCRDPRGAEAGGHSAGAGHIVEAPELSMLIESGKAFRTKHFARDEALYSLEGEQLRRIEVLVHNVRDEIDGQRRVHGLRDERQIDG